MSLYNNNKKIFTYISQQKYQIIKDSISNNILYIKTDDSVIKCKYFLLFTICEEENKLIWSSENPYVDNKTKALTSIIKNKINEEHIINYDKINNKNILQIINNIIKKYNNIQHNNEIITLLWVLTSDINEYKQFYVITEIIYFK